MVPIIKIFSEIKMIIIKRKISISKHIKFLPFSRTDDVTIYEGCNRLGRNTKLKRGYIGFGSYIADNTKLEDVWIGRFCSIGSFVHIVIGKHPSKFFVSTHPAFYSSGNDIPISYTVDNKFEEVAQIFIDDKLYTVKIGNGVWIGDNVLILSGVTIGDGAIIGAGAVVTKDVAPYTIVGGVPAKTIRKRFQDKEIDFLLKLKWWNKSQTWLAKYAVYFNDINSLMTHLKNDCEG